MTGGWDTLNAGCHTCPLCAWRSPNGGKPRALYTGTPAPHPSARTRDDLPVIHCAYGHQKENQEEADEIKENCA